MGFRVGWDWLAEEGDISTMRIGEKKKGRAKGKTKENCVLFWSFFVY